MVYTLYAQRKGYFQTYSTVGKLIFYMQSIRVDRVDKRGGMIQSQIEQEMSLE